MPKSNPKSIEVTAGFPKPHLFSWPLRYEDGVVVIEDDKYQVDIGLETPKFNSEEIKVTLEGHLVSIDCQHSTEKGETSHKSDNLHRRFSLAHDVDLKTITCTLNSKGILEVIADKNGRRGSL